MLQELKYIFIKIRVQSNSRMNCQINKLIEALDIHSFKQCVPLLQYVTFERSEEFKILVVWPLSNTNHDLPIVTAANLCHPYISYYTSPSHPRPLIITLPRTWQTDLYAQLIPLMQRYSH